MPPFYHGRMKNPAGLAGCGAIGPGDEPGVFVGRQGPKAAECNPPLTSNLRRN